MNIYILQLLNGLGNGMIYFLIAIGLSVVFGIMHFLNIAHGVLYLLGAYLCYAIVDATGSFWLALIVAPAAIAALVWFAHPALRRLQALSINFQILSTLGIALIVQELVVLYWGEIGKHVATPSALQGAVQMGIIAYPKYRLFVIGVAGALALVLWVLLEKTRFGAVLRAGTESQDMTSLLGIDVQIVFAFTFALGAWLAAVAGVLAAPIRGVEPFMGNEALMIAFVVVVIGGIGSFSGALVAALLIGVVQSLMTALWSSGANIMIYVAMTAVILLMPRGLMGRA